MDTALLSLVAGSGWASGLRVYLVAFGLGLSGRLGWVEGVPEVLTGLPILVVLGLLLAAEELIDKVPVLDSTWDTVHTVVRPVGAAALGWLLTGELDAVLQATSSGTAGGLALLSHASKATLRGAINASPEPASNALASLTEDGLVLAVLWLAVAHPIVALAVVALLLAAGGAAAAVVVRRLRRRRGHRRDAVRERR